MRMTTLVDAVLSDLGPDYVRCGGDGRDLNCEANMVESFHRGNGEGTRDGEGPCVLVVDDNEGVANALARLLDEEGWRPVICYNGLDALKQVECIWPAAAVVDIHLPDISGLILSSKLRERFGPKLPIIVLSGDTSMENIRSLAHVGATYFISKPFNSDHLIEQLRELAPT